MPPGGLMSAWPIGTVRLNSTFAELIHADAEPESAMAGVEKLPRKIATLPSSNAMPVKRRGEGMVAWGRVKDDPPVV